MHGHFHTDFVISNYDATWAGIGTDWRDEYIQNCDYIMDDAYDSEKETWKETKDTGKGKGAFVNMMKQKGEMETLFQYANELDFSELWLWTGEYLISDPCNDSSSILSSGLPCALLQKKLCDQFWTDLAIICDNARKKDWASAKEVMIHDGTVYCQYSDCRECDGQPSDDKRFWNATPLGPVCPNISTPIWPRDPFTQNRRSNDGPFVRMDNNPFVKSG